MGLKEVGFGAGGGSGSDGDGARSIRTIVPHELDRVDEEHKDWIARQGQQGQGQAEPRPNKEEKEKNRRRRVKLGRTRTPEPMGLGMAHLLIKDDEEPRCQLSPRSYSVIG